MSLKHFWYTLLDNEGEAVPNADVYVYEAGTSTEISIYNQSSISITQPIITDSEGIFEFYVKDQYESSNNYGPGQRMKLSWSASASSVIGEIDNAEIFDKVYRFEDFNAGDTQPIDYSYKNKLVSNQSAYNWTTHTNTLAETENLHNILPVDIYDPSNSTYNKSVSNDLINDLWSLLASAQSPSITASGGISRTYEVSGSGLSWTPSGDTYYDDFNHGFGYSNSNPLIQMYDDLNKELLKPYKIIPTDENNIRIWVFEDIAAHITIIG